MRPGELQGKREEQRGRQIAPGDVGEAVEESLGRVQEAVEARSEVWGFDYSGHAA
jgi:hypothetical protein